MLGKLFLLFTVVTLVELALLIQLGDWMGLWWTLALIFGTGFLGAWLARAEGLRIVFRLREDLRAGRAPTDPALDGLLVILAAAFLITPGVLTDALGFALLAAPARAPIKRLLRRKFSTWTQGAKVVFTGRAGPFRPRSARVGEVLDVRDEATAEDAPANAEIDASAP